MIRIKSGVICESHVFELYTQLKQEMYYSLEVMTFVRLPLKVYFPYYISVTVVSSFLSS
jgi:hypothetical protein